MKTTIIRFGLLAAAVLLLLALSRFALFYRQGFWELVIALSAILLLGLGYVLATYLRKPQELKSQNSSTQETTSINQQKIEELGITKREYEVLQYITEGLSNKEIGQQLFISESTVKSHVSNILSKMGAQRRTQASKLAKDWKLII